MALPISSSYRIFWTGKYVERAEVVARVLDEKLLNSLEKSAEAHEEMLTWGEVLKAFGVYSEYLRHHGKIAPRPVLEFFVFEEDCPSSIFHSIHMARENASGSMPDEIFVAVNKLYLKLKESKARAALRKDPHEFLTDVMQICMQVVGTVNHIWG